MKDTLITCESAGNREGASSDLHHVSRSLDCAAVQDALSAALDGEPGDVPADLLEAHLRGCPTCRAYDASLTGVTRRSRLRPVEPALPDVTSRVVAAHPLGLPGSGPWPVERLVLLVLGVVQLLLSVPPLVGADLGVSGHVSREVGVTDVALALGLLAATWQPWRAAGMLPVIVTLAGGLAAVAAVDVAAGRVSAASEAQHLLAPVSALLLYLLRRRTPGDAGTGAGGGAGPLRAVP